MLLSEFVTQPLVKFSETKITLDHTATLLNEVGRAPFHEGVGIGADTKNGGQSTMGDAKELTDALKQVDSMRKRIIKIVTYYFKNMRRA